MTKFNVDQLLENDNIGIDFIEVLTNEIESMVESHIEAWKDRYYPNSVENISNDLYLNHDISLEIEFMEDEMQRELEIEELDVLKKYFNESVLNEFR